MGLTGIALVTGGAGFIGSHLASALVASGARVRIIDDLSTGYRENIDEIGGDVDFIQGSVADEAALKRAIEGAELVFHEAAIPSVRGPSRIHGRRTWRVSTPPSRYCLPQRKTTFAG